MAGAVVGGGTRIPPKGAVSGEACVAAVRACWDGAGVRSVRKRTTTKGARSAMKKIVVHVLRRKFAMRGIVAMGGYGESEPCAFWDVGYVKSVARLIIFCGKVSA